MEHKSLYHKRQLPGRFNFLLACLFRRQNTVITFGTFCYHFERTLALSSPKDFFISFMVYKWSCKYNPLSCVTGQRHATMANNRAIWFLLFISEFSIERPWMAIIWQTNYPGPVIQPTFGGGIMGPHAFCTTVASTPGINTLISIHQLKVSKILSAEFVFFHVTLGRWRPIQIKWRYHNLGCQML